MCYVVHEGSHCFVGVSLITQALYVLVFCTRYLDIFWVPPRLSIWNFTLKNFYTLSSLYILIAMMWFFPRTREREKAWKLGTACLVGSLVVAPLAMLVFRWGEHKWRFTEVRKAGPLEAPVHSPSNIVLMDFFNRPRIGVRPATAFITPTNNRSDRD